MYYDYPESIVDIPQLQFMIEKAKGYDFIILMEGMKNPVKELVGQVKGTFGESIWWLVKEWISSFLFRHFNVIIHTSL